MNKTEILNRLDKAKFYQELIPSLKVNGKKEALGLCPFHDDHNPSLSVNVETGLYCCPVCGAGGDLFMFWQKTKNVDFPTALREIGKMAGVVDTSVKPAEKIPSKIKCVYRYTDEAGKTLFEVVRFDPKTFRQRHPDGKGGHVYSMSNVRLVPYNLPAIIANDTAYICEGEKDADNLAKLGLVATTNPQGAGKWREEFGQYFTGKDVVVLCDNDEPGKKHGHDVARKLNGSAKSIKVVEQLPGVPLKGDVSGWLTLPGNTKEKLLEIIENTPAWVLSKNECGKYHIKITTIDDMLQYEPPKYLIKPFLYKHTLNLLQSLPGTGKSVLTLSFADALTSNKPLWGNYDCTERGKVLIVDEENPGSIHRDRLEKMGIDKDVQIHFIHYQGVKIDNPGWLESLIKFIYEGKYVLVVFDALIRLHSGKENDSDEMSKVMRGFREIVRRGNTTVLIIHHERKSRDGEKRERSRGSGDIIGAIDSQLILEEGNATDDGKELFLHPGKTRLKAFAPIRLVLNTDTLNISFKGNALSSRKGIIQQIVQFLGDKTCCYEEIQDVVQIPDKHLRTIIKNALGKELILDSTLKQKPDYKGSNRKQFYKAKQNPLLSPSGYVSPIGVETCQIEESRPVSNKMPGNVESLDFVECGYVANHVLPHETLTKKHVSDGAKKEAVGKIENASENVSVEPINLDMIGVEL